MQFSTSTGMISSLNFPAAMAAEALAWLAAAKASCSSRLTPYFSATSSAVIPMEAKASGQFASSPGLTLYLLPPIGIMLMLSTPPAMMQSANPAMIRSAAVAIVCRPEEQKRLTVCAGTSTGTPAFIAATRAMFIPCSPSGKAQPMMISSTSCGSIPVLSRSPLIAAAARSSGRTSFSFPFFARQQGVR